MLSIHQLHILLSRTAQISLELHFCVELHTELKPCWCVCVSVCIGTDELIERFRPNLVVETSRPFEEENWQAVQIGRHETFIVSLFVCCWLIRWIRSFICSFIRLFIHLCMSEMVTVRTRNLWTCLPGKPRWIAGRQQTSAETRNLLVSYLW